MPRLHRSPHGRICTTEGCKKFGRPASFLSGNSGSLARRIPLCGACADKARRIADSYGFTVHLVPVSS